MQKKIIRKLLEKNDVCFWCEGKVLSEGTMSYSVGEIIAYDMGGNILPGIVGFATVDHVIPKSCGGSDDPENLVLSCNSCNSRKNNKIWIKQDDGSVMQYKVKSRKTSTKVAKNKITIETEINL